MTRVPVGRGRQALALDRAIALPLGHGWPTMPVAMMPDLRIQVVRVGPVVVPLPRYQTDGAAGMDLHAALAEPLIVAAARSGARPHRPGVRHPAALRGAGPAAVGARGAQRV